MCPKTRVRISLIGFLSELLVFCEKIIKWAICSKKRAIHSFAHSLTSLTKNNGMRESLIFFKIKNLYKTYKKMLHFFSHLSDLLTVAHLSWATWAICSRLLICLEWPEQFAHSRSFVLSNLSKSLTGAHLIWAKWAKERWANERIPSPALNHSTTCVHCKLYSV